MAVSYFFITFENILNCIFLLEGISSTDFSVGGQYPKILKRDFNTGVFLENLQIF